MPTLRRPAAIARAIGLATCLAAATIAVAQDAPVAPDAAASTQPAARRHHARAELVAEGQSIVAGQPFTVAVVFRMDPQWHVYWKDPGDSGMPPSVKWTLPPGYTAGEFQYPTPKVLKGPAGTNYVYEDEVALLVEITPPATAKVGDAVPLVGDLRWLECDADVCLPARGRVTTSVTVAHTVEPKDAAQFQSWRDKVKAGQDFDPKKAKG